MDNLFQALQDEAKMKVAPLAARMRPEHISEVVGQEHAIGPNTWLRNAIEQDALSSVILYGPAGTGKTTIARLMAHHTKAAFVEVSAVSGSVTDLRKEIKAAEERLFSSNRKTILFIDEIHRFSRSQQDALLHAVEDRVVVLVGATTENPFFEVNSALNSRSRIVELKALTDSDIACIIDNALVAPQGLNNAFELAEDAKDAIVFLAAGDARFALNTLELASQLVAHANDKSPLITKEHVETATPHRVLAYDKNKDMHYDIISAFIKSMRGSDPDAALYWMARMLDGGEDPKFIARRIFIFASEDIGNADPQALLIADATFRATEVIGMPECRINLAQAAVYMALAPKSNASYMGLARAQQELAHGPRRDVPSYLRDRHRPGSDDYGEYKYPHNYPGHWVDQQYLPDGLERGCFFEASEFGWEADRVDGVLPQQTSS